MLKGMEEVEFQFQVEEEVEVNQLRLELAGEDYLSLVGLVEAADQYQEDRGEAASPYQGEQEEEAIPYS